MNKLEKSFVLLLTLAIVLSLFACAPNLKQDVVVPLNAQTSDGKGATDPQFVDTVLENTQGEPTLVDTRGAGNFYSGVSFVGDYIGIYAKIKTPATYPAVGSSGQSCWVTNYANSVNANPSNPQTSWVQVGLRYYSGFKNFKTYFEYNYAPTNDYFLREIGTHALDTSVSYEVKYKTGGSGWDAYIGGSLQDNYNMGRVYANVQAFGESHNSSTVYLGPYVFNDVKTMAYGSASYVLNTTKQLKADLPYKYLVHINYYWFTVYGGP